MCCAELCAVAVRAYDVPAATLHERLLPAARGRGRLFFGYDAGAMAMWEAGGIDFVTAEWIRTFAALEDD